MVEMLTVAVAAERYRLSKYHVRLLLRSGQVHGVSIGNGGKMLVNALDLERYLTESFVTAEGGANHGDKTVDR